MARPSPHSWSLYAEHHESRDQLYSAILASGAVSGAGGVCLDTAMLGDAGRRLAAVGVSRLLVLPDWDVDDGSFVLIEDPDPDVVPLGPCLVPSGAAGIDLVKDALWLSGPARSEPPIEDLRVLYQWMRSIIQTPGSHLDRRRGPLELLRQFGLEMVVVLSPCSRGLRATWASSAESGDMVFEGLARLLVSSDDDDLQRLVLDQLAARSPAGPWQVVQSSLGPLLLAVTPFPPLPAGLGLVADFMEFLGRHVTTEHDSESTTVLQERARLAAMIHDSVTQQVTNVATQLQLLEVASYDPDQFRSTLRAAHTQVAESLEELRRSIYELMPSGDHTGGLVHGLSRFVQDYAAQWDLEIRFAISGEPREIDPAQSALLFSFVQECLTNVRRHARATMAKVELIFDEVGPSVRVSDDGVGFDPETGRDTPRAHHFGIHLMEARARLLGARTTVRSRPGEGSSLDLQLPGPPAPRGEEYDLRPPGRPPGPPD
ncbi:MAG: sensor histidine kinase [Acidimicrobiales bacterium]